MLTFMLIVNLIVVMFAYLSTAAVPHNVYLAVAALVGANLLAASLAGAL